MNLDQAQVAKVRQWIEDGLKANQVQTKLLDELGVKMTYAEVRFLLGDLELRPKDPPPPPKPSETVLGPGAGSALAGGPGAPPGVAAGGLKTSPLDPAAAGAAGVGGVKVTVDEIARPTMAVSGRVTFSDGQAGEWGIDQMGRPRLIPATAGYRPSQPDILEFQAQLEQALSRFGY